LVNLLPLGARDFYLESMLDMNHCWIGIAEDLTEHGVIGSPYAQPSTPSPANASTSGYPVPPKNGRAKTFLIVAGIVAAGALTSPGRATIDFIKNRFLSTPSTPLAQPSSVNISKLAIGKTSVDEKISHPNLAASAAHQQLEGDPAPKKKLVKQKQAASSDRPASPVRERVTDTSPPAAESEVDLKKYRNLAGRI